MLAKQPPYDEMISVVAEAWTYGNTCRTIGMTASAIPGTAIDYWCDRRPWIDTELRKAITAAIRYLDAEWRKRSESKRPPKDPRHPRSRR